MATLEKIRSKSVLLFTIIIVALLAFILGDFLTSGRSLFGGGTTIAQIGDHKIDVQLFQQRVNEVAQQMQQQGQETDMERIQAQVLQQMLFEKMMDEEMNKIGITVTGKELADVISQNPNYAPIYDAIKNPGKYNIPVEYIEQLKQQLAMIEQEQETQIEQFLYGYMFEGLFVANELNAKNLHNIINTNYAVSFTSKELASLHDEEFPVNESEIKAEWAKEKYRYQLDNEVRNISFFTVNINPSFDDVNKAEETVNKALSELAVTNGVDAIASNVDFAITKKVYTPSKVRDFNLKSFIDTAKVGQVTLLSKFNDTYSIAKLLSSKVEMDSVNISEVRIVDTVAFDSVVNAMKSGVAVKTFAESAQTQATDSVWIQLTGITDGSFKKQVLAAKVGQVIPVDTVINGERHQSVYRVNKTTPAVKISEVAEIKYVVEPSQATIDEINGNLDKFLAENTVADSLIKNAPKAGYILSPSKIDATTAQLNFIPETRSAVKWAMNANKGDVSGKFVNRDNNRIVVVALIDIYDSGYIPYTEAILNKQLTDKVRDAKKAEKLLAEFDGKANDLDGYCVITGDSITNAKVNFNHTQVNTLTNQEDAFVGKVAAAKEGDLIGPFKTSNTIAVVRVDKIETLGRPYDFKEYGEQFNRTMGGGALARNWFNILKGNNELEYKLLDFYE